MAGVQLIQDIFDAIALDNSVILQNLIINHRALLNEARDADGHNLISHTMQRLLDHMAPPPIESLIYLIDNTNSIIDEDTYGRYFILALREEGLALRHLGNRFFEAMDRYNARHIILDNNVAQPLNENPQPPQLNAFEAEPLPLNDIIEEFNHQLQMGGPNG